MTRMAQEAPDMVFLAGDEVGLYLQATICQICSPIGQTTVIRIDSGRAKMNPSGP